MSKFYQFVILHSSLTKLILLAPILDWKEILSKTSVLAGDQMFKDTCKTCFSMKQKNRPTILGTSLTSFEPEPSIRLYMARGNYLQFLFHASCFMFPVMCMLPLSLTAVCNVPLMSPSMPHPSFLVVVV